MTNHNVEKGRKLINLIDISEMPTFCLYFRYIQD